MLVTLQPPLGGEEVHWQVRRAEGLEPVREGAVAAGRREFSIDRVSPGRYQLLIMGNGPLQRFAVPAAVIDGEATPVQVRIEPSALSIRVTMAGVPLDAAAIELFHRGGNWTAKLHADSKGEASEEIWQHGLVSATVSRMPALQAWPAEQTVDADKVQWDITVSSVRVRGRVVESATGLGVADALVRLGEAYGKDSRLLMSTHTAGDGSYEFAGVAPGDHLLAATKQGYSEGRVTVTTSANDQAIDRDLPIARLSSRPMLIVDHRGLPIPAAVVLTSDPRGVREAGESDAEGKLMLPLYSETGRTTLFVLPRTGSIAIRRLDADEMRRPETLTVRVPEGTASLEVHAQTSDGHPLRTLVFLRIDGVMLPPTVFERWANVQGLPLFTDAAGSVIYPRLPAGQYDLWLIGNRADHDAVLSANRPPPAASISLTSGREVVTARFERAAP